MTDQSKSLYEMLGVERTATQAEIKKAYYTLCLKLHPDKNPGDEEANSKFQSLQKVYAVLGDTDKRATYDSTGITDDDLLGDASSELYQYFKGTFNKVTEEDLNAFYDKYRGSEEEREDLLKTYNEHKGNMDTVMEYIMCSDPAIDSHRFMDTLKAAIAAGEVKEYRGFTSWSKGVTSKARPTDPLKKRSEAAAPSTALVASIQQSKKNFMSFVDQLAEKYANGADAGGGKKGKNKKKAVHSEPTEEEFEAMRAKLDANKAKEATAQGKPGKKHKQDKHSRVAKPDDDEEEEGVEQEEEEVVVTVKRKGKGKKGEAAAARPAKRKAQRLEEEDDDDEEEEVVLVAKPKGKVGGKKSKKQVAEVVVQESEGEEVEQEVGAKGKGKATKAKQKLKKGQAAEEEEEEAAEEAGEEEEEEEVVVFSAGKGGKKHKGQGGQAKEVQAKVAQHAGGVGNGKAKQSGNKRARMAAE